MRVRGGGRRPVPIAVAFLVGAAILAPGGAGAATVVNGDFETGNLNGWSVHRATESGNWFAYKGTSEPIAKARGKKLAQPPPQGTYAAITDELQAESLILSQDVVLAPGMNHRLSLLVYYNSLVPLAVPSPDTLAVGDEQLGGQANQQFRVDVMRAGAPLESLDPADVLRTVFRTEIGGPTSLKPTLVTVDLSPYAGQTVKLRIANAAHQELFNAGVDAISIDSTRPGEKPQAGSNRFSVGKVKLNRKNGTATLAVDVSGPGTVRVKGEGTLTAPPKTHEPKAHATMAKKRQVLIAPARVVATRAGSVTLRLKPTAPARRVLRQKHKLRVPVEVSFSPVGSSPRTVTVPVVLKLAAPAPHRR